MSMHSSSSVGGSSDGQIDDISQLDYPYKRLYIKPDEILARFNRLKTSTLALVKGRAEVFSLPRGSKTTFDNIYLYTLVKTEDYDLYDNISDYFQEQVRVKCKRVDQKISSYEYWQKNKNDIINNVLDRGDDLSVYNIRETLYGAWYECTNFRPSLFVGFYKLFNKERPIKKVLDMSMGWGDRLIGALATDIELYVGTDPNSKLFDGYNNIINTFGGKDKAICINSGFETADVEKYGPYDMVFSSPPYFNLEIYSDEVTQSIHERDLESWYSQWLIPSLRKAINNLSAGGVLIININNIRNQPDYTMRMVGEISKIIKYRGCIPQWSGERNKSAQPFWIWQKI